MQDIEEFSGEVRRITDCPYVPCLKILHHRLHRVHLDQLERWAQGNECQIDGLVLAVLEGLAKWPYAFDVMTTLCHLSRFRQSLLQQRPEFLSVFLRKAIDSESGYNKYKDVCISLLSSKLQQAVPIEFSAFLQRMVVRATTRPSPETIRPIHHMLSVIGIQCIDCVPKNLLTDLQETIKTVLGSLDPDNHLAHPLCLSLLIQLAGTRRLLDSERQAALFQTLQPAEQFFNTKRYQQTLNLVVLKAVHICAKDATLSLTESCEILGLSTGIVSAIPTSEKASWYAQNMAKRIKLFEKISRSSKPEVQIQSLNLVCALVNGSLESAELLAIFDGQLLNNARSLRSATVQKLLPSLGRDAIQTIVQRLLKIACSVQVPDIEALEAVDNARHILDMLMDEPAAISSICDAVMPKNPGTDFQESLTAFTAILKVKIQNCSNRSSGLCCPHVLSTAISEFRDRLRLFFIRSALSCPLEHKTKYLAILNQLIESPSWSEPSAVGCTRLRNHRKPFEANVSIFEAQGTPEEHQISRNWKDTLARHMARDADYRFDHIVRTVDDVCRDLEARCNEVEQPLREQRAHCEDLKTQLIALQGEIQRMKRQVQNCDSACGIAETERDELLQRLQATERRLEETSRLLLEQKEEVKRYENELQETSDSAARTIREQDLTNMASVKVKDEQFKRQTNELHTTQTLISRLEADLEQGHARYSDSVRTLEERDSTIATLRQEIVDLKAMVEKQHEEEKNLQGVIEDLEREKSDAIAAGKDDIGRKLSIIEELQSQLQSVKDEQVAFLKNFDEFRSSMAARHDHQKVSYNTTISGLHLHITEVEEKRRESEKRMAAEASRLREDITRLRDDRNRKARQIGEMGRQFMTLMGAGTCTASPASNDGKPVSSSPMKDYAREQKPYASTPPSFNSDQSTPSDGPLHKRIKSQVAQSPCKPQKPGAGQRTNHVKRSSFQPTRRVLDDKLNAHNRGLSLLSLDGLQKDSLAPIDASSGILTGENRGQYADSPADPFDGDDMFTSNDQARLFQRSTEEATAPTFIDEGDSTAEF